MNNRPNVENLSQVTTPLAAKLVQLLGPGATCGSITLTRGEFEAVKHLYGFKKELPNKRPDSPKTPDPSNYPKDSWAYEEALRKHKDDLKRHEGWKDPQPFMQAGADRNALRAAEADGLRLLAWIAKFVPAGEDPLAHLVQAAVAFGWDVDPEDVEWAEDSEESCEALGEKHGTSS
jgi:hypothetical protein